MSTTLVINTASKEVDALSRRFEDKQKLHQAMASGGVVVVREHFRKLTGSNRNPYGKRASFWPRMYRAVHAVATAAAGFVNMPREVGQRYHGGVIRPIRSKYLAIPARGEAYGKSPREFNNLRPVALESGGLALVEAEATALKKSKKGLGKLREIGGIVFFWLKKSVTQRGDDKVLPNETLLLRYARGAAREYLRRRRA